MRITIAILLAFGFLSCTTVYFKEAQPQDTESLSSFPEDMLGSYIMDLFDTLIIEKERYSLPEEYKNSYSLTHVDSNPDLQIKDDLFYDGNIPLKSGIKYHIRNDSIFYKKRIKKYTALSDSLVIKSFKQYLIMNARDNKKEYWTCFVLEPKGNDYVMYVIGDLKTELDSASEKSSTLLLQDYEKITHFEKIGDNKYLVDPTKSEFKKLINKGLFTSPLEMKRINFE